MSMVAEQTHAVPNRYASKISKLRQHLPWKPLRYFLAIGAVIFLIAILFGVQSYRSALIRTALFELRNDRTLPEALIAERTPTSREIWLLQKALTTYRNGGKAQAVAPIERYLAQHPASPWRVSLRTNLGLVYYRNGYFSKALRAWELAWTQGRNAKASEQLAITDRAFGELVRMHARLGHAPELRSLISGLGDRALIGSAAEAVAGAREGLWMMENNPGVAFLCGPMALRSLLSLSQPYSQVMSKIDVIRSGTQGVSLTRLDTIASSLGMSFKAAQREPGAEIPVPSVVHWKVNHYAAIVGKSNGRYQIKDPTFGEDLWLTADAINAESSGYFMVPAQLLGHGWKALDRLIAGNVRGMGYTGTLNPKATRPYDEKACDDGCEPAPKGMPDYAVHSMLVSLNIQDVPVGYTPPKGPSVQFHLTYNQREANQPANPTYGHIGPQWNHNWLSYVQDDPAQVGTNVTLAVAGGGTEEYTGYDSTTRKFTPEPKLGAELVISSRVGKPIEYERRFSDGSVHVYAKSDGATFFPRRVFLTAIRDSAGNTLLLTYDAQKRLATIRDALGQMTSFAYEDASNSLRITKVTDPFGRFAKLAYDTQGRLNRITDTINMSSSFTYLGTGTFINTMTTPYGTTNFAYEDASGTSRWIEITDPLGFAERVETLHNAPGIPNSETAAPAGMGLINQYLQYRNSFYWDKDALELWRGDYTKARLTHWLHGPVGSTKTFPVIESTKLPGENRVWLTYPNQVYSIYSGSTDRPIGSGRVLDDGTTQKFQTDYNRLGRITKTVDPLGREVVYTYASNDIDLLQIRRKNGAVYDVLATYSNYNALHQPQSYVDAAGQTTTYLYNAAGQRTRVRNPLLQDTIYTYDVNGYLQNVRNANNIVVQSYTYDGFGRVASLTDSEGYRRDFQYDALDRLTRTTYPDATYEENIYDRLDRTQVRDRLARTTVYTFNANRQLKQVDEPLPRTIKYDWTRAGRLSKLIDGEGHTTEWQYDVAGRKTAEIYAEIYADTKRTSFTYDLAGRLRTVVDPLMQVKTNTYTLDDQLSGIGYANTVNPTASVGFAYDPVYPRRTAMNDGLGNTSFAYKPVGTQGALQLANEDGPFSNDVVAYSYDAIGRVQSRSVGGQAELFVYDAIGRVSNKTNALGSFELGYLGQTDQLQSRSAGTGPVLINAYDDNLHDRALKSVGYFQEQGGGGSSRTNGILVPTQEYRYQRNPIGTITHINEVPGGQELFAKRWDVGYDDADRVRALTPLGTEPFYSYTYDRADNRPSANLNGTTQAGTHNTLNQLTTLDAQPYQYDFNGNLLSDGANQYHWDAENRLVKVVTAAPAGKQSVFGYDGLGRRLLIQDTPASGQPMMERRYTWCDEQPCQERDAQDNALTFYFDEGELQGSHQVFYLRDQLGSVRQVQDPVGGSGSYDYGPYGEAQGTYGSVSSRYRYAGMFHHTATGLYLTWYRPYRAQIGRWLTRDPIGVAGGTNLYAYVEGNPISYIDPLGLSRFDKLFGLPKEFWKWYHRRVKKPGDKDIDKDEAESLHKEWKDSGCPTPDSKKKGRNNQDGSADLDLVEWMIPWQVMPVEMSCAELDCDNNGKADFLEPNNPKDGP